ncbi:MAG: hypothetical protein H0U49_12465 [Parachlamydiaceae bacterium]|nr:hypothetical protein [Parachlamydiaceae bacterium]
MPIEPLLSPHSRLLFCVDHTTGLRQWLYAVDAFAAYDRHLLRSLQSTLTFGERNELNRKSFGVAQILRFSHSEYIDLSFEGITKKMDYFFDNCYRRP